MTGWAPLLRLALRRDRIMLPAWVYGIVLTVVSTASSYDRLYPTEAERAQVAAGASTGALRAITGPAFDLTTVGGLTAWRIAGSGAVLAALMSLLVVVRHTRAEEDAGRTELVGAAATGRYAVAGAGLLVAAVANGSIAVLTAAGLVLVGLPVAGSIALGLAIAAAGLVFAAVALVTAQVASVARAASGTAGALLALAFLLRAVGDSGAPWLSWLSPIGWTQQVRAFSGERWWVFALPLALTAGLVGLTGVLLPRRDVGAGLRPQRPGPPVAAPRLAGPLALAWRLQRGTLLGWTAGYALVGVAVGAVASDVGDLLGDGQQATDLIDKLGGGSSDVVRTYLALIVGLLGLVAAAYAVQAVLRARTEETAQRAEPVLAAGTPRLRWAGAHVLVAAAGSAWLLAVAGVTLGLVHGLRTGDPGQVGVLTGAALAQLPAVWVLGALAAALAGAVPRLVAAAWAALAVCLLLGQIGQLLSLPDWLLDASPFQHTGPAPLHSPGPVPLAVLVAVALGLAGAGAAGLRRRDIG
ncbi:MAG TPA: ABC transporter permease [Mycobacteriales bacterium]|nr:ABC transporter permease [Mycobacteriales bacterium]